MESVDASISAAESSYLFGNEVELHGLKNESMNGLKGVARGYFSTTGRRAAFLHEKQDRAAVKPAKIRLVTGEKSKPVIEPGYSMHRIVWAGQRFSN
jgi:hypothetical protein